MPRRSLLLVPASLTLLLAACSGASSEEDNTPAGPAPTDPIVFEASADTKKDIGVAKWGFDDNGETTTFHGYDAKNAQLLELRESIEETADPFVKRMTMKMTGKIGSASATIDIGIEVAADFQSASYTKTTIENSFETGVPGNVLAHLGPDSMAMVQAKAAEGESGLVQPKTITPKDATDAGGGSLVSGESQQLLVCCSELTNATAALSANAGMSCALTPGGQSTMIQGQSIKPLAIVRQNGRLAVVSPWNGPYNIVDNHCHNAAAANSSKTDGYIGCHSTSSTTTYSGHTINWAPNPYQSANKFCAYEPQANGGSISSGNICCFNDTASASGAPSLVSRDAQSCVSKLCLGQANFAAGGSPPQAFPAGSTPPVPNDCPSSTTAITACNTCCTNQANTIAGYFPAASYQPQVAAYRTRCAAACQQAETARTPPPAANPCAPSVLQWLQSRMNRSGACGSR